MNKRLLIFVFILTVVVISFVSAGWFGWGKGDTSLSPSRATPIVDAHQCTADGTCEINNAKVGGNLEVVGDLVVGGKFAMDCQIFSDRGPNTCAVAGYDSCIFRETTKTTTYYDSSSTCAGNIQVQMTDSVLTGCDNGPGGGGCQRVPAGVEPYAGDQETLYTNPRVLCCR